MRNSSTSTSTSSVAVALTGTFFLLAVEFGWAQLTPADIDALRAQGAAEGWTFTVAENDATRRPLHELCGAVEPPGWREQVRFDPCEPTRGLPDTFDWRDNGGVNYCSPIKDQESCGSCWAFATMGSVESAIKIREGGNFTNLSEQWLISCTDAGSCEGGWHTESYQYLRCNGWPSACGFSGAVLERDFPYEAAEPPCNNCPYPHPYCIDSWAALGPRWGIPSVEQIKQAILEHGPVSTCVYVDYPFQAYDGDVFNACTNNQPINHAVVLVGWDDNQGTNGVWFLRNSWGPYWGENGYMRIEYGCSLIGYATCYVDYTRADCNTNGVRDTEDIANGTSADCNTNDIPDECDIANGTSYDCNLNGVPDEVDIAWPLPEMRDDVAAVYGWIEISATGTPLNLEDDGHAEVPMPFENGFFKGDWVQVGNNGAISPDAPPDLMPDNEPIPNSLLLGSELTFAPFWDDLDETAGNVYWQTIGTAPERTFIVEWHNRPHWPGDTFVDGVTFQVQVFERPVDRVFAQYLYLDTDFQEPAFDNGASASIGFQRNGRYGDMWSFNQPGAVTPATVLSVQAPSDPLWPDENNNGVPDACEGDCNTNGIPDEDDIASGFSDDCQPDGVPDECQLADNDCDGNSVPDDCQPDSDSDGVIDPCDACPTDPAKTEPGYCGCGVSDLDSDSDGLPDCADGCPYDPQKTEPGICGCGISDSGPDTDGDGTLDCIDGCPYDSEKTEPGVCGCGISEIDSDGDGTPDCNDLCSFDPNKTAPGKCGCGVPETDCGDSTSDDQGNDEPAPDKPAADDPFVKDISANEPSVWPVPFLPTPLDSSTDAEGTGDSQPATTDTGEEGEDEEDSSLALSAVPPPTGLCPMTSMVMIGLTLAGLARFRHTHSHRRSRGG
ncbi:MAG: hypothetical protein KAY37_00640 [Phycisphaerae bacterium]|nr:hypothetical protein [Phycisphaerae bacterium]